MDTTCNFIHTFKRHIVLIMVIIFIAVITSWVISCFFIKKTYKCSTTLIISAKICSKSYDARNVLLEPNYLKVFHKIALSDSVADGVIQCLGLNCNVKELKEQTKITVDYETGVAKIEVKNNNHEYCQKITETYIEIIKYKTQNEIFKYEIFILDPPKIPTSPIYPNIFLNILLAFVGGTVSGSLVAIYLVSKKHCCT